MPTVYTKTNAISTMAELRIRIAEFDCCVKLRKLFWGDDTPFDKFIYNGPDALMNEHLSQDQTPAGK
jgi:hypothetical protein